MTESNEQITVKEKENNCAVSSKKQPDLPSISLIVEKKLSNLEDIQKKLNDSPFYSKNIAPLQTSKQISSQNTYHNSSKGSSNILYTFGLQPQQSQQQQFQSFQNLRNFSSSPTEKTLFVPSNFSTSPVPSEYISRSVESISKEPIIDPSVSERYRSAMNQLKRERNQLRKKEKMKKIKEEKKKALLAEVDRKARDFASQNYLIEKVPKKKDSKEPSPSNVEQKEKDAELISRRSRRMRDLQSATVKKIRQQKQEEILLREKKKKEFAERLAKKQQMAEKQRLIRLQFKENTHRKSNSKSNSKNRLGHFSTQWVSSPNLRKSIFYEDSEDESTGSTLTPSIKPEIAEPKSRNMLPFVSISNCETIEISKECIDAIFDENVGETDTSLCDIEGLFAMNGISTKEKKALKSIIDKMEDVESDEEVSMEIRNTIGKSTTINHDTEEDSDSLLTDLFDKDFEKNDSRTSSFQAPLLLECQNEECSVSPCLSQSNDEHIQHQMLSKGTYGIKWTTKRKRLKRFYRYTYPYLTWGRNENSKVKKSVVLSVKRGAVEASNDLQDCCITLILTDGRNLSIEFESVEIASIWFETVKNSLNT
eukprot:TRINITY_DN1496_c0_g1_i1.p1 TRINITY_DN1496_c0_g1~~TRINITY_DN1496_c0_g1_i1.p1  ORF type:complete len:593 (+),score=164.34 TRINITY_DN1496_c0_g1_i1:62-1840(+)